MLLETMRWPTAASEVRRFDLAAVGIREPTKARRVPNRCEMRNTSQRQYEITPSSAALPHDRRQMSVAAAVAVAPRSIPRRLVRTTRNYCKVLARGVFVELVFTIVGEVLAEGLLSPTRVGATIRRPEGKPLIVLQPLGSHRTQSCARRCACARSTIAMRPAAVISAVAILILCVSGCAALRRGPVPEDVATCRDLTQQGVTAMEMDKWPEAEQLLQSAVEASPVDPATRHYLAEALWHRGATEAALVQMEEAVRLDDTDPTLIVRLGEMRLGTGATDRALERADEAIALNPKLASAWALRGRVYWRMNQTDRALADLQRSLQFAPDASDVLMDIAAIYRQRGQHDRCLTTLQHLLDTYPPGQGTQLAYWMEGLTLADLGRPEQAIESLRVANQQGPANADILYYLAQAQLAAGRPDAATTTAEQALAINPTHAPSRQLLTQLATTKSVPTPVVR